MNIVRCTPNVPAATKLVVRKYGLSALQGEEQALQQHVTKVLTSNNWSTPEALCYSFLEDYRETIVGFTRLHKIYGQSREGGSYFYMQEFCFGGELSPYRPGGGIATHELLSLRLRLAQDFPKVERLTFTTHRREVGTVFREMFTELYRIREVPADFALSREELAAGIQPDELALKKELASGLPRPTVRQQYVGQLIPAAAAKQRLEEICEATQAWMM